MSEEYMMYIDDSGTKEYADKTVNLFCYAGIILRREDANGYVQIIKQIKERYFSGNIPEIKSNWLRIPKERKKHFLIPYNITDRCLNSFTKELYKTINSFNLHVIGVVVDKVKLKEKYLKFNFYPSSICYEFILQRIANYSTQYKIPKVTIVIDDMSGKTPRGSEWKKLLIQQHKTLLQGNSPFYPKWSQRSNMNYNMINRHLYFRDSAQSQLIQIADLCAYNIFRQARESWNNFDKEPFYQGYKWILPIMHKSPDKNKKIANYGAVCFPRE